ncbi:MAG: EpsG family protein [Halomonadaceae bacterium]|jgi:hypothetical protein
MVYFSLFVATLGSSLASMSRSFPAKKCFFFLCSFIFLIVSLRYASVDYFSYLRIYEGVGDFSKFGPFIYSLNPNTPVEVGFALLIILEKLLFGHYFIFVALFSTISLLIKFYAFKKLSPYVILSLLLYLSDEYFWKDLGQIRNAMASGIVLWALYYAYLRKFWIFLVLVFSASLFHGAALVALPFYLVGKIGSRFFLFSAIIASLLTVALFGGIGQLLVDLGRLLGLAETSRLIKYVESQYVAGVRPFGGTFNLQLLICLLLISFKKSLSQKWSINEFFIPAYVYGSCLFFIFLDYGIVGGRIREMIAIPIACVILPSFVLLFRGYSKFLPCSAIALYCAVWFYMMMDGRAPYQTVLQFLV